MSGNCVSGNCVHCSYWPPDVHGIKFLSCEDLGSRYLLWYGAHEGVTYIVGHGQWTLLYREQLSSALALIELNRVMKLPAPKAVITISVPPTWFVLTASCFYKMSYYWILIYCEGKQSALNFSSYRFLIKYGNTLNGNTLICL